VSKSIHAGRSRHFQNLKGYSMFIGNFADLMTAIDKLDAADRLKLAEKLAAKKLDDIRAAAEQKRAARLDAAMQNEALQPMIKTVLRQLRRLGLDFEKIAAKADVASVDKAARELPGFTSGEAIELKTALARLGAIN
jgi:hypothetical protein